MIFVNEKINRMCEARGWTLYQLSDRTEIPYSTLNSAINRNAAPKIDTLQRICDAFGISLAQFFMEDEQLEILSLEEKKLVTLFRKLTENKLRAIIEILEK